MPTRKKRIVELKLAGYGLRYKLYPASQDKIKNALKKMQAKTGAKTSRELYICESAFIAAGIEAAHESSTTHVTPRHVLEGYNKRFRYSMAHPMWRCMPRSVLDRTPELRDRSDAVRCIT